MPMIRVREKHQITLPKEIVTLLNLRPDSYLEYSLVGNGVIMRPAQRGKKKASIFQYAGVNRNRRTYATAQEADAFISGLRDEWDR